MPSNEAIESMNPERKSLKDVHFIVVDDDGVKQKVPALSKHWASRSIFANYNSLVVTGGHYKEGAALEEWQHDAQNFKSDMEFLLSLKHHEFWSYMVFQKSALSAVVSFLQKATPFYISLCSDSKPIGALETYEEILNLVLRIICRILSPKESSEAWIKKEDLRGIVYSNYLISVPMLFDLVVAVGNASRENSEFLCKIFDTLLAIEPNYKKDLLAGVAFLRTAFRSIHTQTENEGFEGAGGGLLDEACGTPFDDVALFTLDCAFTLSVLLDVCPAVRIYSSEIMLAQNIANFYDSTLPYLYKNIFVINETSKSLMWINQARLHLLKAFRSIAYSYVESVLANPENRMTACEDLIGLMTECLSEQTFVVDYERHYPLIHDFDILKQACPDLDTFKADFVVNGYQNECAAAACDDMINAEPHFTELRQNPSAISSPVPDPEDKIIKNISGKSNGTEVGNEKKAERDLDLEVTMILDCLPHLGTGFIRQLLSRYDKADDAIAAVLEGNLPPDLVNADQSEPFIPPDPQDKLYQETGVRHYNVFDGDKYDIMTQDKPQCIIKQGKGMPNRPQNANQLLDDKRDLAAIKHRYQEYSLVTEGDDDDHDAQEYNDEYDDSYEALLESETRVLRSKDMKKVLANVIDESEDDESESEEDNSYKDNNRKSINFCENPEDIRARYEARRQAKWSSKPSNVPSQARDVTGKAKGQGQEKEVLRNRQKKEATKSSRANHNRKAGAAFKRSKGMI